MKTLTQIHIGGRKSVSPDEVILLEADINYTKLYLLDGKKIHVATTLKQLEKRFVLLQNFFRTNKSYIINLSYMANYQEDTQSILMQNEKSILVSRRRKKDFSLMIH
jgi:two-component system LytT family response regulator